MSEVCLKMLENSRRRHSLQIVQGSEGHARSAVKLVVQKRGVCIRKASEPLTMLLVTTILSHCRSKRNQNRATVGCYSVDDWWLAPSPPKERSDGHWRSC
ncbi:hypothetical protein O6H91_09G052100 [Diphasiastrum complanatum]|uniref:Uncharacterized protein n=1 Tax=Diphasiastrum complanatum TaxID=34168 RepID=A0ACC2CP29_DIPCM|nr:hypothetical protein O6H91_09G052100 [Diphasiastrum complanatum]